MLKVNLLPWREQKRKFEKKRYISFVVFAIFAAFIVLFAGNMFLNSRESVLKARVSFLKSTFNSASKKASEKSANEERFNALLEHAQLLNSLQGDRYLIAHLFNTLNSLLPDQVRVTNLYVKDREMRINGRSNDYANVVEFMRNIRSQDWIYQPTLEIISREKGSNLVFQVDGKIMLPEEIKKLEAEKLLEKEKTSNK